jgi:hypothetical protein
VLDFLVLAAPRSGTAWASVWLTGQYSVCYHDPLWDWYFEDLDQLAISHPRELCGVSCTGLANFPDWVMRHPAPKVILHRPPAEVAVSAKKRFNRSAPGELFFRNLDRIPGLHVPWTDLWENAAPIYEHLLHLPFDEKRHALLKGLRIETQERKMSPELRQQYARQGALLRD